MAISDSVTVSLPSLRLKPYGYNEKQIEPQNAHEMPVDGRVRNRTDSQSDMFTSQAHEEAHETRNATENMQGMRAGQNIQEGTVGTRRQIESLRGKFFPNPILPHDEGEPKRERYPEPAQTVAKRASFYFMSVCERTARHLQRKAAEEQYACIHVQEWRNHDMGPVAGALSHKKRTGERRERHGNCEDPNPDAA